MRKIFTDEWSLYDIYDLAWKIVVLSASVATGGTLLGLGYWFVRVLVRAGNG